MKPRAIAQPPAETSVRDEDLALFRDAVTDVTPVAVTHQAQLAKPRPKPIPGQLLRDERAVLKEALSDPLDITEEMDGNTVFVRPGLPRNIVRRLRSGYWSVRLELDLHGYSTDAARAALVTFLHDARQSGQRCVRVIHGKGLRSQQGVPVLRHHVRHWLIQRDEILAFAEALPAHGGSGAVVVLLKSNSKNGATLND